MCGRIQNVCGSKRFVDPNIYGSSMFPALGVKEAPEFLYLHTKRTLVGMVGPEEEVSRVDRSENKQEYVKIQNRVSQSCLVAVLHHPILPHVLHGSAVWCWKCKQSTDRTDPHVLDDGRNPQASTRHDTHDDCRANTLILASTTSFPPLVLWQQQQQQTRRAVLCPWYIYAEVSNLRGKSRSHSKIYPDMFGIVCRLCIYT